MNTKLLQPNSEGIDTAARLLQEGQLVAIPTETVYGLAANAMDGTAVASIFAAKDRPMDNPLIVHIADLKDWAPLVTHIPEPALKLADAYWPGPLTMILPATDCVPKEVTGGLTTVAVRFPAHPVAQAVILRSGCPLAAPSANRSGAPSPTNADRVMEDMQGRIPAILDGGSCDFGVESTVLDLCHTPPRLLRPGGITPAMLEEIVGKIEIDAAVTQELQKGAIAASPGMKYKHYAPKAEVHIVKGHPSLYQDYVYRHKGAGVFALCFEENSLDVPAVTYGKRSDPLSQAQKLFDALRQLDERGAQTVYAACPPIDGVGLAVYNRLLRAAAFRIINPIHVIGLTGPTGAGKSTVAEVWRQKGVPVIDTDLLARKIVEPNSPSLAKLTEAFSNAVLNDDGTLNRTALAKIAFSSPEQAKKLNAITHPAILALTLQELEKAAERGCSMAAVDAPLLFEAEFDQICDCVVSVIAPKETRLSRIVHRDNLTDEMAQKRMSAQQSDEFYCREGVHVIHNSGSVAELQKQAAELLTTLERRWSSE